MFRQKRTIGQAIVEFALAATLIFFLLSAAVDVGMIMFAVQGLHNAAQEGAMYGSAMPYTDEIDYDKDGYIEFSERDTDGDGVVENDIYDNVKGEYFEGFLEEVRKRASYEAGKGGGIGYVNLRDLNSNGIKDTVGADKDAGVLEKYVDVKVLKSQKGDEPCGDPNGDYQCYIRVKVSTIYRIQFPLAPALPDDQITLSSEFTMPLNKSGFTRFGEPMKSPIIITLTPTTTPFGSPTTTPTLTATPTPLVVCDDYIDDILVESPWLEKEIGTTEGDSYTVVDTSDDTSTIKVCSSAPKVQGYEDDFYYIYEDRTGDDAINQEFIAKISDDWEDPKDGINNYTKAGLMIRNSVNSGSPFVMVSYRPDGNNVMLQYRQQQVDFLEAEEKVVDDTSVSGISLPVWLRLIRSNDDKVIASYSTASGTPTEDEWVDLGSWVDVDLDTESTLYGVASVSGYTPNPSTPMQFLKATFEDVQMNGLQEATVEFIDPYEEMVDINDRDLTTFEISTTLASGLNVASVTYELIDPYDDVIWDKTYDSGDEWQCTFGYDGSVCEPMDEEDFNSLLQIRNLYYTIKVDVTLDDGRIISDRRYFKIGELYIAFTTPMTNGMLLQSRDVTNFEIDAYDPKVGSNSGDGIAKTLFRILYKPYSTSPICSIYEQDSGWTCTSKSYRLYEVEVDKDDANPTKDILCAFGGEPNACDKLSDTAGWDFDVPSNDLPVSTPPNYTMLRPGNYVVYARVLPEGGDEMNDNHWSDFVSRQFSISEPELAFTVPISDGVVIEDISETNFNINAWLPHVGTANGDGVGSVLFQILEGEDPNDLDNDILYSSTDTDGNATDPDPYCTFGNDGADTCKVMPTDGEHPTLDYVRLPSGFYSVRALVMSASEATEFDQYAVNARWRTIGDVANPYNYRRFEIPETPVYIDFVDDDDNALPANQEITDISMTNFRVKAFSGTDAEVEAGTGTDGNGIEEVEFELIDLLGNPIDLDSDADGTTLTDNAVKYCVFGGGVNSSDPCDPMGETMYDTLMASYTTNHTGTFTLRASAKQNDGRWSSPVERTFEIPPMKMRFADPDPDPDGENSDYPNDMGDDYNSDGNKVIRDIDKTVFEIEAFDPKYAGVDYDSSKEEDNYTNLNGTGIEKLIFRICGPIEDDSDVEDCEEEHILDGYPDLDLNETIVYDNESDAPLCLFGQDSDDKDDDGDTEDCAPMPKDDFNRLPRGTYVLKARVGNKITTGNGWTDWYEERWISLKFEIPDIETEWLDIPTEVSTQDETTFGFKIYDPKETDDEENGYIDANSIKFYVVGPNSDETVVYSNTINLQADFDARSSNSFCVFGDENDDGVCDEVMPDDIYQNLAIGDYYIRAEVETESLGILTYDSEEFTIPSPIDISFVENYTDTTYYVSNANESLAEFQIQAWKRNSSTNGDGIEHVEFEIVAYDDADEVIGSFDDTAYLDEKLDTDLLYCPFGGDSDACNPMGNDMMRDLEAEGAAYFVMRARAQQIEDDGGQWSGFVEQKFVIAPQPIYTEWISVTEELVRADDTNFGFIIYDPNEADAPNNGAIDASSITFNLVGPSADDTTTIRTVTLPDTAATDNFCVFGGENDACTPMENADFQALAEGTYYLEAVVETNFAGTKTYQSNEFTIPAPVQIEFAYTVTDTYEVSNSSAVTSSFEVMAWQRSTTETGDARNGDGIEKVVFEIVDQDGNAPSNTDFYTPTDTTAPYCPFGDDGNTCNPIGSETMNLLKEEGAEYFVVSATATDVANPANTSETISQQFVVVLLPIYTQWLDVPTEEVVSQDMTNIGFYIYDPSHPDAANNGAIDADDITFHLYGPSGESVFTRTISFDNAPGQNFCVFGGSNSNCETIPDDEYRELESGTYYVEAQVATNFAGIQTYTSPDFEVAPITINFAVNYPTSYSLDDPTTEEAAFGIEAKRGSTASNGDNIDHVSFWIYAYDASKNKLDSSGYDSIADDTEAPYCPFGDDGTTCNPMGTEVKNTLVYSASYFVVWAKAFDNDGAGSSFARAQFEVVADPIAISFIETESYTDTYYIVDTSADAAKFEVQVDSGDVQKVRFEIVDDAGDPITSTHFSTLEVTTAPYCPFGETGGVCDAMSDDLKSDLQASSSDYVIKAFAVDSAGDDAEEITQKFRVSSSVALMNIMNNSTTISSLTPAMHVAYVAGAGN